MAINKKLIHFLKKADFDTLLAAGNILDTSIVFIKDAKQIYTHGQLYNCPFTEDEIRSLLNNKADLSKLNNYLTKTDAATIYLPKGNYITSIPTANRTTAGIVKQGGDVTISNGVITVNDDSHNHIISNVDGLQSALDAKQDIISDLSTIRSNASKGATALLSVPLASTTSLGGVKSGGDVTISSEGIMSVVDDSHNHIISNVDGLLSALDAKLGIISDLSTIRSGAALGATALQSVPAATTSTAGIVKVGSNISVSSGTISLSKANVTAALGYTPPTAYTNMTASEATTGTATTGRVISAKVLHDKINEMLPTTLSEANSYTDTKVSELVGLAPEALNTIYELAEAMATNLGAVDTLLSAIGNKVDKVTGKGLSTNDYTTTEKNKLAGIASGAEVNVQSDWSVTDTTSDAYIKNKPSLVAVATSGKYSDLSGRPTVDSAISTSSTNAVQNKAITAAVNAKYTKPSTGIPSSDLSSDVLGSLAKADSALQSFTETDPVFTASAAASIKSSDITNWNSKTSNVGTITGIKMNGKSKGTSGVVDLGTVITAHQDISGKVDKVSGKGLSTNDYTDAEKSKLAGIASGAEVNQNAFSNVKVGDVTVAADSKTDTLTLVAGSNVTITPDATNTTIKIAAKNTTYSFSNGNPTLAWGKQSTVGTVGGTALTVTMPSNPNSHYSTAIKAGESETNSNAAVSNPYVKVLDNTSYRSLIRLVGGGATTVSSDDSGNITISSTNTTYGEATSSAAGLMSAADKSKLAGIAAGANKYSLPLAASGTRGGIKIGYTASGVNIPLLLDSSEKAYVGLTKTAVTSALGYTPPTSNTTYSIATNGTSGLIKPWYNHTAASTGPTAGSDSTAVTVNSLSTTSGRYYALEMDSNGRGFVNVPWRNSTYTSLKNPNSLTVQYNGTTAYSYDGSAAKTLNIKAGSNITVSGDSSGNITINGTPNTTYAAGKGLTLSSTTFNVGAGTGISVGDDTISVKYGTAAGTAAQGNDSRLSDARNPKTTTLSTEDLNNVTTPGFYAGKGSNTVTNKPSGIDAFGLIVFKTASGYITQELIEGNTNAGCRWTRQYTGSSWGSWIPMPTFSATPTSGQVVVTEGTTGKVKSSGYTIAKSVPSNAVFTDTHWTTGINAGASGAVANSAVTNPYVTVKDNSTYRSQIQLKGSGSTTVSSDANGVITINSTDTNTTYSAGSGISLSGTTFSHADTSSLSGSYGPTANVTGSNGATIVVPQITVDGYGHVTGVTNRTYTSKDTNTTYSAISTDELNTGTATTSRTVTAKVLAPWVKNQIDSKLAANDAMLFKGTIGSSGATVTALPASHNAGWTYKVITAGTYAGKVCEIGDMIICITDGTSANDAHWTVVQTNVDGTVTGPASSTDARVAVFNGTTGKVIKDSGFTIGKSVPSNAVFTDTHYTSKNIVGASNTATANATASNGSVYLNHLELSSVKSAHLIKGTGATTVTSDSNGNITINSNNTWRGITNSVSTTSSDTSASATAVKTAYDKAVSAYNLAKGKTSNTGTVTSVATGVGLTGGSITTSGTIKAKLRSETALTNDSVAATEKSGRVYPVAVDKSGYLSVNVPWTDTNTNTWRGITNSVSTTSSDISASATAVKTAYDKAVSAYNLANGKTSNTGTVTSVATGKGLTGGTITGSGTIKCNLNSETSLGTIGKTSKLYAVGVDANNKLCVSVPWTDNNTTYTFTNKAATLAWNSAVTVATVGGTDITVKLPANPNSDTKVTQTVTTTNANYPLLFAPSGQKANTTTTSYFNTGIYANASTKSLYATNFYSTSDKQFKTNIESIITSDNCPKVRQFDWKENGSHSYGFIAQELEEQGYKELVSINEEDGSKTVNYSATLSLVVGKMQARIEELERKILELESKLN